jgi:putative phosphoesterase
MEVVVLSDSHLTGGLDALDPQIINAVAEADVVLHAGDITSRRALAELEAVAATYAVLGNNDHALEGILPQSLHLDLGGVHVAMVHDSGPRKGRPRRLRRRFPDADLVIFGHSHVRSMKSGKRSNSSSIRDHRRSDVPNRIERSGAFVWAAARSSGIGSRL